MGVVPEPDVPANLEQEQKVPATRSQKLNWCTPRSGVAKGSFCRVPCKVWVVFYPGLAENPPRARKESWSPDNTAYEQSPRHQPPTRAPTPTSQIGGEILDRHQAMAMRLPQAPRDRHYLHLHELPQLSLPPAYICSQEQHRTVGRMERELGASDSRRPRVFPEGRGGLWLQWGRKALGGLRTGGFG